MREAVGRGGSGSDGYDSGRAETRVGSLRACLAVDLGGGVALAPVSANEVTEVACTHDEEIGRGLNGHLGSK